MRSWIRSFGLEVVGFAAVAGFLWWGLARVPFHPDEASLLFESRDLELLVTHPLAMAWRPGTRSSPETTYRLLNAPLPKYILGLGRRVAGYGPESVAVDWNWSRNWEENVMAGALPPADLLEASRAASTIALLAAIVASYVAGRRIGGRAVGWAAAILLGLNALALLHGRRAMSEGTLLMGVALSIVGILSAERRPWLAGLTLALAVNAKFSPVALVPVGLLATAWSVEGSGQSIRAVLRRIAWFGLAFIGVTLLLQPVLWRHPFRSLQAMWQERQALLARQVADMQALAPDHVISSLAERTAVLTANIYLAPLQFEEVGNYTVELRDSYIDYQRVFGHSLLRSSLGGGLLIALTLLGLIWGLQRSRREGAVTRRLFALLFLATFLQGVALVAAIPIPIQRYTLPLLPFLCLWESVGLLGGFPRHETQRRPEAGAASGVETNPRYS